MAPVLLGEAWSLRSAMVLSLGQAWYARLMAPPRRTAHRSARRGFPAQSSQGGVTLVTAIITWLSTLRRDEEGQGLAEYALILALIAILVIGALIFLGGAIEDILNQIGSELDGA
jgi:pilus assembly protein Flp/PilA